MPRASLVKFVNLLLLIWFMCTPLFWRLDLSKGTSGLFDVFAMAPYGIIHIVIFYALILLAIHYSRFSVYYLLLLSLYFPLIQLANFPLLTIRDVYLHGAPTETILANGRLSYPKDPRPESWPSSFDLHATVATLLGCDIINANYLLYLTLVLVFTLILYCFTKRLDSKGYRLACYSSILFLCLFFSHLFDNFHHYSRTALGFTFLFLFFFSFIFIKGRRGNLLQILTIAATITTHPFHSLALTVFLISYCVITYHARRIGLALFSIAAFVGWFLFNGSSTFVEAVKRLETFLSLEYVAPLQESFVSSAISPWWAVILREFFKYSLITLMAGSFVVMISVLYQRQQHNETKTLSLTLLSLFPMAAVMLSVLLLLPDWKLLWSTPFAAFPVAFSSFLILDRIVPRKRVEALVHRLRLPTRKISTSFLLLFVVTMSAGVMILRFERNYYLAEVNHPSELSSLSFLFEHSQESTVHIVSWRTSVYSTYYNYNSSHVSSTLWYKELDELRGNSSAFLNVESGLINRSQYVVRGIREGFDMSRRNLPEILLETIDEEFILPAFNLVCSNGYYTIHCRAR